MNSIYEEIAAERKRQNEKWGEQNHHMVKEPVDLEFIGGEGMIEIPLGKALVAVINNYPDTCIECFFHEAKGCTWVNCNSAERKDGKSVIFKLIDFELEEKKNERDNI